MSALKAELIRLIRDEGPLPVSRYMALCLGHPRHGYYMTRDPLGAVGDFTTAPEISQIFGELIGLWAGHVWQAMGAPDRFRLVELGPGRGTLMADALRAAKLVPGFREAVSIHLVETSPVLRQAQAGTLATVQPVWHETIVTALDGPVIVLGNEFLDALPLDQFVMTPDGWRERLVGLDAQGELAFGLTGEARPTPSPLAGEGWGEGSRYPVKASPVKTSSEVGRRDPSSVSASPGHLLPQGEKGHAFGSVFEHPQAAFDVVSTIAAHLAHQGGAALFIDYGSAHSGLGDTLQAVRHHAFAPVLADPGEADLTVHVDFARMAQAALVAGAACHGPVTQRDWLLALGLAERAQALSMKATPDQAAAIAAAAARLTDPAATGMGALFKVLAFSHSSLPTLPGFDLHRLPEQP